MKKPEVGVGWAWEVRATFHFKGLQLGDCFLPGFLKLCSFNRSYLSATDPDSFLASWKISPSSRVRYDDLMPGLLAPDLQFLRTLQESLSECRFPSPIFKHSDPKVLG